MIDHAPRILARRRAASLRRAILFALAAITLLLAFAKIGDRLADMSHERHSMNEKYTELTAQQEAFIQCLNGRPVSLDNAVLTCQVRELIAGVNP